MSTVFLLFIGALSYIVSSVWSDYANIMLEKKLKDHDEPLKMRLLFCVFITIMAGIITFFLEKFVVKGKKLST